MGCLRRGWRNQASAWQFILQNGEAEAELSCHRCVYPSGGEHGEGPGDHYDFEEPVAAELQVPGWTLVGEKKIPALVSVHTKKHKDCEPQFSRLEFPYRTTLTLRDGQWHVVEFSSTEETADEIEELEGKPCPVVTFFAREPNDVKTLGDVFTGDDDPFLQPARVSQPYRNSEAWQGRSLEDGVYGDDEEAEMGEQLPEPLREPVRPAVPVGEEIEEFELEGEAYTKDSSLKKIREGLAFYGLPKGGNKAKCWKRLVEHHKHFAERAAVDIAKKEFRRKQGEESEEARMQSVPKQPSKSERQIHELTHWPYQPWCQACVACRAKGDPLGRPTRRGPFYFPSGQHGFLLQSCQWGTRR